MIDANDTEIDIHALLQKRRQIAVIWGVEDVQHIRPDLTEDQAWEVLRIAESSHDAEFGINWNNLEEIADELLDTLPCKSHSVTQTGLETVRLIYIAPPKS